MSWIAAGKRDWDASSGRNKATLAALREATGLRFEVDNDAKRVTIAGDRDAIAVAANLVASIANVQFGQHPTTENVARAFADAGGVRHRQRAPEPGLELASPPGESAGTTGSRSSSTREIASGSSSGRGEDHLGADEAERVRHDLRPGEKDGSRRGEEIEKWRRRANDSSSTSSRTRGRSARARKTRRTLAKTETRESTTAAETDDYGEGGAENRAGESPEKTKPAKDAEEEAENLTAKGPEAKGEARRTPTMTPTRRLAPATRTRRTRRGGRARTRRRAVAAVAAEGADADADADADAAVARTNENERGREEDATVQDDPRRCDGSGVAPSARYRYT